MKKLNFSGREAIIQEATFDDSYKLFQLVSGVLAKSDIKLPTGGVMSANVEDFLPIVARLVADNELKEQIFVCLKYCSFNKENITKDLFEQSEYRKIFFTLVIEVLKINLADFLDPLLAAFKKAPSQEPKKQKDLIQK